MRKREPEQVELQAPLDRLVLHPRGTLCPPAGLHPLLSGSKQPGHGCEQICVFVSCLFVSPADRSCCCDSAGLSWPAAWTSRTSDPCSDASKQDAV